MLENHSNIRNSFNTQKSLKYSKIIVIHEKMLKLFKTDPIFANYSNTRKILNFLMTILKLKTLQNLEKYSKNRKLFKNSKTIQILENHSYSQK